MSEIDYEKDNFVLTSKAREALEPFMKFVKIGKELGYQQGFEDGKKSATTWSPIEQAPKDQQLLLCCHTDNESLYLVGWFDDIRNEWSSEPYFVPTHFMPLPELPENTL